MTTDIYRICQIFVARFRIWAGLSNALGRLSLQKPPRGAGAEILSPTSSLPLLVKTITHPAARSLCDNWASCSILSTVTPWYVLRRTCGGIYARVYNCKRLIWQLWTCVVSISELYCGLFNDCLTVCFFSSLLHFVVRVRCGRKVKSSRSLSHLLMSFL